MKNRCLEKKFCCKFIWIKVSHFWCEHGAETMLRNMLLRRERERERERERKRGRERRWCWNNVVNKRKRLEHPLINIHFTLLDNEQKPQTNSARKLRSDHIIDLIWGICVTYSISKVKIYSQECFTISIFISKKIVYLISSKIELFEKSLANLTYMNIYIW